MNAALASSQDWHPADIKAALAKKGYTFNRIAREYDYSRGSPRDVLRRTWRPMELIVAHILGVPPETIWPSRYQRDPRGERRSGKERRSGLDRRKPSGRVAG